MTASWLLQPSRKEALPKALFCCSELHGPWFSANSTYRYSSSSSVRNRIPSQKKMKKTRNASRKLFSPCPSNIQDYVALVIYIVMRNQPLKSWTVLSAPGNLYRHIKRNARHANFTKTLNVETVYRVISR